MIGLASIANLRAFSKVARAPNPVGILGSALLAWWTADRADLISLSGNAVTSWRDVVAGYDATQSVSAARPIYSATGFNGAPGLTFDGVDDELLYAGQPFPSGTAAAEIWVLADQEALAADTSSRFSFVYGGASNRNRVAGRGVTTGVNSGRGLVGNGTSSPTAEAPGNYSGRHLLRIVVSATDVVAHLDGVAGAAAAVVPNTAAVRTKIGANASNVIGSNFWQGKIRDVLVTNPLTTAQANALTTWALPRRML